MNRARTALLATMALALALTAGCSDDDGDDAENASDEPAPEYSIITEDLPDGGIGEAELLIPDATVETAEAAIRDYADTIDGPEAVTVQVVRTEDAAVIVCRADWPDLDDTMNCPDPGGN
ncbi:hypothetical protein [Streptomyces sp. MP131-18]|uniref:hypothetical protein n=1 Tax=Streptomyces sp. MP131-18 TaxID=1857892 RepID=UPI0009CF2A08|nr:hypothetical protein [Streptomyces sp. MP131-18]ONK09449.1 hypothetical protein STBA_01490 [Streptomyces sp. MP131-18]